MTSSIPIDVRLIEPGALRFEVDTGDPRSSAQLAIDLVPSPGGVRLTTREATASEWRSVTGTLSADEFAHFVERLRAALATPPLENGSYDCGTYGEWVLAAEVSLPLSSGTLAVHARETEGFASLPVLEVVHAELARLAAAPGSGAVSWASVRRAATRAKRLRLAVVGAMLVLVLFAWASGGR